MYVSSALSTRVMSEPPDDEAESETGDSLEDDAVDRSPWWNTDLASVLFLHSDKGGGEELGRGGGASSVGGDTSKWSPTWLLVETSSMVPLKMSTISKSMHFRHNFHALVLNSASHFYLQLICYLLVDCKFTKGSKYYLYDLLWMTWLARLGFPRACMIHDISKRPLHSNS